MACYLVTGAAGFIAHRLTELLLAEGHRVVGVDNMNDAYDVRMKEYRLQKLQALPNFEFLRADIAERATTERLLEVASSRPFDAILHLAARAGVRASVTHPHLFYETNVIGTLNLLELCRQARIPKFVLASTSSVYGANAPLPTPETADSSRPLQPYAASKKAAETLAHAYHALYDLDVTVVRYFTVYGPAGRPDMSMFRFTQWIYEDRPLQVYGDGRQARGFTYVDDIARGTIAALRPLGYEIVNLGGHEVITINDLIALLERLIGKKARVQYAPPNPADMAANWADVSKARALLGWSPQYDLEHGVGELVRWYQAERAWVKAIQTA
jgi:UDP-glucuronate 4-epimerase